MTIKYLFRYILFSLLLTFSFQCFGEESPKYEMRGAWLTTVYGIDWPSTKGITKEAEKAQKAQLDAILKGLHKSGFNAVFMQVRPMADALYRSSLAPWSSYLTGSRGAEPAYDPLAYCIEKCHEYGMECHAWLNPFRVGQSKPSTKLDKAKSHLWMTNTVGNETMTIFNPAHAETQKYISRICGEIAENYDIDGIIFDDYFYSPSFIPEDSSAADWKDYQDSNSDLSFADWRRDNVNKTIAAVYKELQRIKDGKVRFGVAPQGIGGGNGVHSDVGVPPLADFGVTTADSQYAKIYCDPVQWLKMGIIDYISPQIYWHTYQSGHPYAGLASWWNFVAELFDRHCFTSHTISEFRNSNTTSTWNERIAQVEINRDESAIGCPGSIFYSASYICGPQKSGFGEYLRDNVFASQALIPPMTWKKDHAKPININELKYTNGKLTWKAAGDSRYVVYVIPEDYSQEDIKSETAPGISADFIEAITYKNEYTLSKSTVDNYRIAVTAYDRYGNEWKPAFLKK